MTRFKIENRNTLVIEVIKRAIAREQDKISRARDEIEKLTQDLFDLGEPPDVNSFKKG
jgi:hypothetical protein